MSEGSNIAIALGILFLIGGIIPVVVGVFYDVDEVELTGIYSSLNNTFGGETSILGITIIGLETGEFITSQIQGYSLFDNYFPILAKGIIILISILMLYAVVKALPTT